MGGGRAKLQGCTRRAPYAPKHNKSALNTPEHMPSKHSQKSSYKAPESVSEGIAPHRPAAARIQAAARGIVHRLLCEVERLGRALRKNSKVF